MDPGYFSAFAALAGSLIGGLTSLAASWLSQHVQFRTQQIAHDVSRREELYKSFIEDASNCLAAALVHDKTELTNLVKLYAMVNRMRVLSSPRVVESAEKVVPMIVKTYGAPKQDIEELVKKDALSIDPLREFSNACRKEFGRRWASPS